jgi:hypothetical protein
MINVVSSILNKKRFDVDDDDDDDDNENKRKFPCTECAYKATTKQNLQQHMLTHTGLPY